MKITKKKRKKKNRDRQVCSQEERLHGSFLRQCQRTLLITASYQLFSVCLNPTTLPLPPIKPGYDYTHLDTVPNPVAQLFHSPAFAAAPPVGPSSCVKFFGGTAPGVGMTRMPATMGGMMLMNSILDVAIQGLMQGVAHSQQMQAQRKTQAAQIQQWLAAEQERLANLVAQQRSLWDADVKAKQNELASALSDSEVVDLRPHGTPFFGTGGDSSVVDLRDRTRDIPEIPDGNKPPRLEKPTQPIPQSESAKKLATMIKDNQNPAKLDENLKKLEDQLGRIRELSEKVNKGMDYSPQDLQALNQGLTPVIQEGLLRGISLVMGLGPEDLISFYKEMKANPARMHKLLDAMNTVNQVADFATHYDKFKPGELKDGMWNEANRNIMKNLDFFRTQHAVNSEQFQAGKNMVKESMDLAQSQEDLGKIEVRVKIQGLSPFFWDRKKQLDQQVQKLAETTRGARRDLALKKTLPPIPDKPEHAPLKLLPPSFAAPSTPVIKNLKVIPLDLKHPSEKKDPPTKSARGEPPLPTLKYHRVVFQGVVGPQQEGQGLIKAIQNDPSFKDPDQSLVFTFPGGLQSDQIMYHPEKHRDYIFNHLQAMKGAKIEFLGITGNMIPLTEMLIRENFIEVKFIDIITDQTKGYPKLIELRTLANERGINFNWWVNRNGKLVNFAGPTGLNRQELERDLGF